MKSSTFSRIVASHLTIASTNTLWLPNSRFVPKIQTVSIYIPNLTPFLANSKLWDESILDPPENSYRRRTENRGPLGTSPTWWQATPSSAHCSVSSTSQNFRPKTLIIKSDFMVFQSRCAPARTHVIRRTFWIWIWNLKTFPNMNFILKGSF